ncbi:MAG: flagellar filament outer layer protein FlaA [Treponema sp.]|jgi:hypothetical protein|nr:flagellar filament outer layer protein FlaA [Treponema sp.]
MKHGSFRAICLIFLACIAVLSAFGDEQAVALESRILETFDQNDESLYDWRLEASKFATKTDEDSFPKVTYVATWPAALFGSNPDGADLKSLGIWGRFDRRGYNWIDVYPVNAGEEDGGPAEIPIPGRVRYLDMWVWGSNLNYHIEAYLRDYQGVIHTVDLGSIGYQGWKNLQVAIPNNFPQAKRVLPRLAPLTFVKFRIWTAPTEQVDNFYIYFDQLKVLTDTFEAPYDGDELANPARVQELWNSEGGL